MRKEQMALEYSIKLTPTGYRSVKEIKDKKVQREIGKAIDGLAASPETQGKALVKPLEGVRSLRAVESKYRILYTVDNDEKVVWVLLVGERKHGGASDIYAVASRLLKVLLGKGL